MRFHNPQADLFVPDGVERKRCAFPHHPSVDFRAPGRHRDHGLSRHRQCFGRSDQWFTGVVVTNGAGSPRTGIYGHYTDEEMQRVRLREQRKAAYVGEYACVIQLGYSSSAVKDPNNAGVREDLLAIFRLAKPEVVYLHNPGRQARYARGQRPCGPSRRCASWARSFVPRRSTAAKCGATWTGCRTRTSRCCRSPRRPTWRPRWWALFDSQVSGGKRYDLATAGRRLANATYYASHATDVETALTYAMDLTPLIEDPGLSVAAYTLGFIDKLKADVEARLKKLG